MRIFVQIASYRDPELLPTIRDCIAQAARPENLTFGICHQHHADDGWDNLNEFTGDRRFRVVSVPAQKSRGCVWARSHCAKLYAGEEFTLQIDSHMRFAPRWDQRLIETISVLPGKPILSTYVPSYNLDGNRGETQSMITAEYKTRRIIPHQSSMRSDDGVKLNPFIGAAFIFARGEWLLDVPPNPAIYFWGEEIDFAVRSWTRGYDIYCPSEIFMWHRYGRKEDQRHWKDHEVSKTGAKSIAHVQNLLLGKVNDSVFGLGSVRSLEEYERFAGINFSASVAVDRDRQKAGFPIGFRPGRDVNKKAVLPEWVIRPKTIRTLPGEAVQPDLSAPVSTDPFLMIYVPRTASMSVRRFLLKAGMAGRHTHTSAAAYFERDPAVFEKMEAHAVIRDPVDRLVSAYFWGRSRHANQHWQEHRFAGFKQARSFTDFCRCVEDNWTDMASKFLVLRPQVRYVADSAGNIRAHLWDFARLDLMCAYLRERFRLVGPDIGHLNRSPRLPVEQVITIEAIDIITELYKEDVAIYAALQEQFRAPAHPLQSGCNMVS